MSYTIREVIGKAASNMALAEFLAAFVRRGGLVRPQPGDDRPDVWRKRFSWWWDENPFCRPDSPCGYQLETGSGEIVGFSGYIPFDYEKEGEAVPTLIATTFFVLEAHRSAVMGLLARQRSLGRQYQIIDGSPSPQMRRLLSKLRYEHAEERFQYYFPLIGFGGLATQALLKQVGLSLDLPSGNQLSPECYFTSDPFDIETIPTLKDGKLHRRVTVESLSWLCRIGSGERSFFGYCDAKGELIAYAIGIYKKKFGFCLCLLEDYVDFRPHQNGLGQLLRHLTADPIGSGLLRETDLMALSIFRAENRPGQHGLKRNSNLYYHLPDGIDPQSKRCLAIEGDLALI
ncbi:MAG: hypothetical protein P1U68_11235 [Verrucomicrobiales bacterium]|nr:hypothetical protein [Verrucomicrobiales bacterium]